MELGYDKTSIPSIFAYSQKLIGHSLRELVSEEEQVSTNLQGQGKSGLVCDVSAPSSTIHQHEFPKNLILYTMYIQTNLWSRQFSFSSSLTNIQANGSNVKSHQGNGNTVVQRLVRLSKFRASAPL